MTVAVACNLSDGAILGVDSAVTLTGGEGVWQWKVYENAEKLFQLGERPIGVATFGLAVFADRTTGSLLREFQLKDPGKVVSGQSQMRDVAEEIRAFFHANYVALIEKMQPEVREKFEKIPPEERPWLGLVLAGFSHGEYLSEVWEVQVPRHDKTGSSVRRKGPGEVGSDWFAMCDPIVRYLKGYDIGMLNALGTWVEKKRGSPLTPEELKEIAAVIGKWEYQIPFQAMPIEEGIRYTRFLVELVINHHRFAIGPSVVGGKTRLGMVTYKGEKFKILDS